MLELGHIRKAYFAGIGGIGMSAIARYFKALGITVCGYDRTATELTRALEREGMQIWYDDDPALIPQGIDLVVFTPAIPASHRGLQHFRAQGYPLYKRAEVLGLISRNRRCVAIAGTHGKTSTSSLCAHLMRASGVDATAFVGGLALNLGGNYAPGSSEWVVVEADEFDRSFLHLRPEAACINSTDPDHLDIYGDHQTMLEGFADFAALTNPKGLLLLRDGIALPPRPLPAHTLRFGIDAGDICASNLRAEQGYMAFNLHLPDFAGVNARRYAGLRMTFPGRYNVENAAAAIALALYSGADPEAIPEALLQFAGVKRRFEFVYRNADRVMVDDYAHHPTELRAAIEAMRALFPDMRLTGVFQPHLFSRTRDFAEGFAQALDLLDECVLLDIYPARELPIPGVSSDMIAERMRRRPARLSPKERLPEYIAAHPPEALIMLGAGDIDTLVQPVLDIIRKQSFDTTS